MNVSRETRISARANAIFQDDDGLSMQLSMFFIWLSPTADQQLNNALQALRDRDFAEFGIAVYQAMVEATRQAAVDEVDAEDDERGWQQAEDAKWGEV